MDSNEEILNKKNCAISDFKKLCQYGEIGFYKSCEVTQLFLLHKETKEVFNYFTIAVFEETEYNEEIKYLLDKPFAINNKFQLGIIQVRVKIKDAEILFNQIQKGNFVLNNCNCKISKKMVLFPKQFVSSSWDYDQKLPIGNLLKQNYWGDSYIIEFFCENKPLTNELSEKDIDKINKIISDTKSISINLVPVFERTENIIFQFPVTIITCTDSLNQTDTLEVSIYEHPQLTSPMDLVIITKTSLDNVTTGYSNSVVKSNQSPIKHLLGDSNKLELYITKTNSDILLHQSLSNYIRSFGGNLMLMSTHDEPRTIRSRSGKSHSVRVSTPMPISVNSRKDDFLTQITRRVLQNDLLRNSGDCKVFDRNGDQENAYQYIRNIICKHTNGIKEVCLWDPYLRAPDIIETLYFQNTGLSFRCITCLKKARKVDEAGMLKETSESVDFTKFKNDELNYFYNHSNNINVDLDYRCQHDIYGTNFHDRFLIFVPLDANELPTVYSLGASVNSLGKAHHLIQKVTDARLILQNFNIMWDQLNLDSCRIVVFPRDLRL